MSTAETHFKTDKQLVPALRFKGFEGDWDKNKLGAISKIITGSTPSTSVDEFYNGNYLFVSPADMQGNRYIKNTKTTLTEAGFDKCRKLKKGSVLFVCIGSTIGKVAQSIGECSSNQQINALEAKENFSNDFIYSLLEKNGQRIKLLAGVQAVPQINKTDFSNFKYLFPSLPEQQKIASFLSAIDEKIQQFTKKKELLEQYKKGVMQKLFTYKKRLYKGELRKGKLGDFGFFYYGKGAPKTSIVEGAPTPCVRYGELYSTFKEEIKEIKSYTIVDPKDLKLSKGGEVLVPRVGEDPLDFANCSYLPFSNVAIGEMISVYNTEEVGLFMTYYINARLKKQLARMVEGGNVSNLYFRYVEKIEVEIPCIEEQQKIIGFLSSIDTKIETVNKKITQTQTFKKGLLQQMFV